MHARFILRYLFRYLVSNRDFFRNLVSIWSLFLSKVSILIKCLPNRFLHVCTAAASLSRLVTWCYIYSSDGCHCQSLEQRCTETKLPPPNPCGVQLFAQVQVNFNGGFPTPPSHREESHRLHTEESGPTKHNTPELVSDSPSNQEGAPLHGQFKFSHSTGNPRLLTVFG